MIRLLRYLPVFCLLLQPVWAQAQDEEDEPPAQKKVDYKALPRQLRFGLDLSKPVASFLVRDRSSWEVMADYHFRKDLYLVVEGGSGRAGYYYQNLDYESANAFLRAGVDKNMIARVSATDWDMVFVGARYGVALINRTEASYVTSDPLWGETSGILPARSLSAHWMELTGGMRVEAWRGLFLGWNIRGRFRINQSAFRELAPAYIAGYGKGDKNTAFDFNFYLAYALRWSGHAKPGTGTDLKP